MILYHSKNACSFIILITLHELAIKFKCNIVNLTKKLTQDGTNYLQINPKGSVPALQIKNNVLTETLAIQLYLAHQHKDTSLLPTHNSIDYFHSIEWLSYIGSELHKGICSILYNAQVSPETKQTIYLPLLCKKLEYINTHLSDKQYLLGNNFSLPDINLYVITTWLLDLDVCVSDYKNIYQHYLIISQRKSVLEASFQEQECLTQL